MTLLSVAERSRASDPMTVLSVLPMRAAGTVALTWADLTPLPEMANQGDDPTADIIPAVPVNLALPPWRASSLSPSYVQYSLHQVSKLSTANRSCIKVLRCT
jgi:hypothetical protein